MDLNETNKNKKPSKSYDLEGFDRLWKSLCRGGRIRTYDLLVPNQARYRATLHPENNLYGGETGIRTRGTV